MSCVVLSASYITYWSSEIKSTLAQHSMALVLNQLICHTIFLFFFLARRLILRWFQVQKLGGCDHLPHFYLSMQFLLRYSDSTSSDKHQTNSLALRVTSWVLKFWRFCSKIQGTGPSTQAVTMRAQTHSVSEIWLGTAKQYLGWYIYACSFSSIKECCLCQSMAVKLQHSDGESGHFCVSILWLGCLPLLGMWPETRLGGATKSGCWGWVISVKEQNRAETQKRKNDPSM